MIKKIFQRDLIWDRLVCAPGEELDYNNIGTICSKIKEDITQMDHMKRRKQLTSFMVKMKLTNPV